MIREKDAINLVWRQERGMITEPSHREDWDELLAHHHIPISRLTWSSQFVLQLTCVIWLSPGIILACIWSKEGERCGSG